MPSELLTLCEIHARSDGHIHSTKLTKYKNKVLVKHYASGSNKVSKKLFQHNGHGQGNKVIDPLFYLQIQH